MRKIIMFNLISLDGFFAGPNGEIDWHNVDDEFNDYAISMLGTVDTLLFGRITYDLMAGYWPLPIAKEQNPAAIVDRMNTLSKIVFSRSLEKAEWNNTQVMKEITTEEMIKLKQQPGKDIELLGSGQIVQSFTKLGLIDEYRLMINPIVLGKGKPLFKDMQNKLPLKILDTKTFKNGNVLLVYAKKIVRGGDNYG